VLMDEASSALDLKSEKKLYSFLQDSDTIYVSVGHRPSLLQYHNLLLRLTGKAPLHLAFWHSARR